MLEPGLPPLGERLGQLEYLAGHFDPRAINWRFDPVCFYRSEPSGIEDNLKDFTRIARIASAMGVQRCITSFMDMYPKIKKRLARRPGLDFVHAPWKGRYVFWKI